MVSVLEKINGINYYNCYRSNVYNFKKIDKFIEEEKDKWGW